MLLKTTVNISNKLDFLHNKGCVALASPTYGAKAPVPMFYARSLLFNPSYLC